jgi:hypothetical protein
MSNEKVSWFVNSGSLRIPHVYQRSTLAFHRDQVRH